MKKLQIIMAIALLSFMFSCKDDAVAPSKETDSIELIATEGTEINIQLEGETIKQATFYTQIKNNGSRDLKVWAIMEIVELSASHETAFCWGDLDNGSGICYPPSKVGYASDFTLEVKAGGISPKGDFSNYIYNDGQFGGTSKIRYIVYEDDNIENRDTIVYTINFQ